MATRPLLIDIAQALHFFYRNNANVENYIVQRSGDELVVTFYPVSTEFDNETFRITVENETLGDG